MKKKKIRQYRSNQGRSPEKTEAAYKIIGWSLLAMFFSLILTLLTKL